MVVISKIKCRKRRFAKRRTAKNAAKRIKRKNGFITLPYYCESCQGWHIGKPGKHHDKKAYEFNLMLSKTRNEFNNLIRRMK